MTVHRSTRPNRIDALVGTVQFKPDTCPLLELDVNAEFYDAGTQQRRYIVPGVRNSSALRIGGCGVADPARIK